MPAEDDPWRQTERGIRLIVVHCTATRATQHYTVADLRRDHVGHNGWTDIGYHIYVTRDGEVHPCRPVAIPGAHVRGFNLCSIGVAWEGGIGPDGRPEDNRTAEQIVALWQTLRHLIAIYPGARIVGHRDLCPAKACPCFDARTEYRWLMEHHP